MESDSVFTKPILISSNKILWMLEFWNIFRYSFEIWTPTKWKVNEGVTKSRQYDWITNWFFKWHTPFQILHSNYCYHHLSQWRTAKNDGLNYNAIDLHGQMFLTNAISNIPLSEAGEAVRLPHYSPCLSNCMSRPNVRPPYLLNFNYKWL